MRKIKWHVSLGFAGADRHGEVDVDDDCTEEEINEIVRGEMSNFLEWGWEEAKKE